jgi:hypothetical protein
MQRYRTHERTEPVTFEALEARLLLDATGLVQPDGPMPQTVAPGCGPPVEEAEAASDADGDGKLGLNDAKATAAGEPTSLTFNGRGIDLNEDEKVDALASVDPDAVVTRLVGVHLDTSSAETNAFVQVPFVQEPNEKPATAEVPIVIDILGSTEDFEMAQADGVVFRMVGVENDVDAAEPDGLGGGISLVNGDFGYDAQVTGDGKITPWECRQLATTLAYEPVWAIGTAPWIGGSILSASGVDAAGASGTWTLHVGDSAGQPD